MEEEEQDEEPVFTVERILSTRLRKRGRQYLVKWEGYSSKRAAQQTRVAVMHRRSDAVDNVLEGSEQESAEQSPSNVSNVTDGKAPAAQDEDGESNEEETEEALDCLGESAETTSIQDAPQEAAITQLQSEHPHIVTSIAPPALEELSLPGLPTPPSQAEHSLGEIMDEEAADDGDVPELKAAPWLKETFRLPSRLAASAESQLVASGYLEDGDSEDGGDTARPHRTQGQATSAIDAGSCKRVAQPIASAMASRPLSTSQHRKYGQSSSRYWGAHRVLRSYQPADAGGGEGDSKDPGGEMTGEDCGVSSRCSTPLSHTSRASSQKGSPVQARTERTVAGVSSAASTSSAASPVDRILANHPEFGGWKCQRAAPRPPSTTSNPSPAGSGGSVGGKPLEPSLPVAAASRGKCRRSTPLSDDQADEKVSAASSSPPVRKRRRKDSAVGTEDVFQSPSPGVAAAFSVSGRSSASNVSATLRSTPPIAFKSVGAVMNAAKTLAGDRHVARNLFTPPNASREQTGRGSLPGDRSAGAAVAPEAENLLDALSILCPVSRGEERCRTRARGKGSNCDEPSLIITAPSLQASSALSGTRRRKGKDRTTGARVDTPVDSFAELAEPVVIQGTWSPQATVDSGPRAEVCEIESHVSDASDSRSSTSSSSVRVTSESLVGLAAAGLLAAGTSTSPGSSPGVPRKTPPSPNQNTDALSGCKAPTSTTSQSSFTALEQSSAVSLRNLSAPLATADALATVAAGTRLTSSSSSSNASHVVEPATTAKPATSVALLMTTVAMAAQQSVDTPVSAREDAADGAMARLRLPPSLLGASEHVQHESRTAAQAQSPATTLADPPSQTANGTAGGAQCPTASAPQPATAAAAVVRLAANASSAPAASEAGAARAATVPPSSSSGARAADAEVAAVL
eukprot:scpid29058/ scgid22982/ 